MKINGRIQMLCPVETGISRATGNKWQHQYVVLVFGEEHADTLACHTFNDELIAKLATMKQDDKAVFTIGTRSEARTFTRKDGSEGVQRSTDCLLLRIETDNDAF